MATSRLDQLVKGAAPPDVTAPEVKEEIKSEALPPDFESNDSGLNEPVYGDGNDPTAILPSSPPQIYLNLLILEASLRSQYLTLRARRRQNTFFLFLLVFWNTFFFYALFLNPREDGSGIGGSVYWVIETTEKVALMGGIVTGMLIWGTGQWERGVRWPRRFIAITNRGLRTMNCKIVVTKGPWWREYIGKLASLIPFSSYYVSQGSSYHYVEAPERRHPYGHKHHDAVSYQEEDLSPGGDSIKLLLLPKPFSPDFRENWEHYRTEYWEKENERRAQLRTRLSKQQRQQARENGGWLWWLPWRRAKYGYIGPREIDLEKTHIRDPKKIALRRSEPHSRNTSRSSTPASFDVEDRPPSRGSRSSMNSTDSRRRPRVGASTIKKGSTRVSEKALERSAPMAMSMATQTRSASGLSTDSERR